MASSTFVSSVLAIGASAFAAVALYRLTRPARITTLVDKIYREIWNEKDEELISSSLRNLISEDHVLVDPSSPNPVLGVDGYRMMVAAMRESFPGFTMRIDGVIANCYRAAVQLTFDTGPLDDCSPSDYAVTSARCDATAVFEFKGQKVVKSWCNKDVLSLLIQLGYIRDIVESPLHSDKIVRALTGRDAPQPEEVLAGQEWLDYFHAQAENLSLPPDGYQMDALTGLDMVA